MTKRPKILFLVTEDWYFWSHRLPIARAARDQGFEVVIATAVQDHGELIEKEGFKLIPIRLKRSSRSPLREVVSIIELIGIYRRERPDIVHHVAMKPVLYGSIAARFSGVTGVVNALAGLGYVFTSDKPNARLLRPVIGGAFKGILNSGRSRLILQNKDDCAMFVRERFIDGKRMRLIRGSGVDTAAFSQPGSLHVFRS